MKRNEVSNKDIYEAINDLRRELDNKIDGIETEVKEINNWRNRVVGQFSVIMVLIGAGVNFLFDSLFNKKI